MILLTEVVVVGHATKTVVLVYAGPTQIAADVMSCSEVVEAHSRSNPNVCATDAAHMAAEAAHMNTAAEASHMATATRAATCLRAGRKKTSGQQGGRQDYHRSFHNIILSVELSLLFPRKAAP
jgi:hypothetical protein